MGLGPQARMRPTAFLPSPQDHVSAPLEAVGNCMLPSRVGCGLPRGRQLSARGAPQELGVPEH